MSRDFAKHKIVALLPLKANSERVKGKNFRVFNGKPLFQWILNTLLSLDEIGQIVINTDARAILAEHGLVENKRILIRDRSPKLCGDMVSMNRILEDDVNNIPADLYLMTHTTNPLLRASTIRGAIDAYYTAKDQNQADSLFTVNRIQTRFYRKNGSPVNHDPKQLIRTQDLEPWFEENSNLYLFTDKSFTATQARIGERPVLFECSKLESIDIDDQESWDFAVVAASMLSQSPTYDLRA